MRRSATRPARGLACLALALLGSVGCDPKAGFESAAGAIDPNQKSYIDGPGSRLAAGPFNTVGIDLDVDTQVHLLARRRDDQGTSMTLFGQDAQTGCTIAPNAATWFASKPAAKPYRLLPFFSARDEYGMGTLKFSTIDCQVEPYEIDNALGPSEPELGQGFLVRQGGGLVLADPWQQTTTPIVTEFRRLLPAGSRLLIWGDSQLIAFDKDLSELARFGNHVTAVTDLGFLGGAFAVEDDDGLHTLTVDWDAQGFAFTSIDPDACALGSATSDVDWVTVHSPCSDDHLVAELLDPSGSTEVQRVPLAVRADSRTAKIEPLAYTGGTSPVDLVAYYLEDVDPASGLGTLFATAANGAIMQVGTNAALERAFLLGKGEPWTGVALVNVQAGLGQLVRWAWDGSEETLAENVDRAASASGILADYDGHSGNVLTVDMHGDTAVEQVGAPPFNTTLRSINYGWALRLEHFDGVTGDLTLAKDLSRSSAYETVAARVPPNQYQFTTIVPLPGFAYIGDFNEKTQTGTLFVQNLQLGSTLTVAKNVSDFVATNYPLPGLLYAVPIGNDAGLWFARAK